MTKNTKRKRAPGAGRPALEDEKKRRIELFVTPTLAAYLNAEDIPPGLERLRTARRRKREAGERLMLAHIEALIV